MAPSDEELAKTMFATVFGRSRDWDFTFPADQACWIRGARALRAALCPPVTPLAPGETVTIPTVNGMETGGIRLAGNERVMALSIESSDGWWDGRFLDAAGVAQ